jgi:competence protein ComEA
MAWSIETLPSTSKAIASAGIKRRLLIPCAVFIALWCAALAPAQEQPPFPSLPGGAGRDTTIRVCSSCHSPDKVVTHGQTREEWEATLRKMAAFGMAATDDELSEILDYLAKNFPQPPGVKINVNKATALEMELTLGLSAREAKSIVEYRAKNGSFKSIDDLKQVPDIDALKLIEKKDRLAFENGAP